VALVANIESREQRRVEGLARGLPPENPRASTTDDVEGIISLFHELLGPIFDHKTFKEHFFGTLQTNTSQRTGIITPRKNTHMSKLLQSEFIQFVQVTLLDKLSSSIQSHLKQNLKRKRNFSFVFIHRFHCI